MSEQQSWGRASHIRSRRQAERAGGQVMGEATALPLRSEKYEQGHQVRVEVRETSCRGSAGELKELGCHGCDSGLGSPKLTRRKCECSLKSFHQNSLSIFHERGILPNAGIQ